MAQLPLDFDFAPRFGADDFLVAQSNADAHAAVLRWPSWPDRVAILIGPEGSGKTHLASIWADRAGGRMLHAAALPRHDLRLLASVPAVIEGADGIGSAETILFHLLNLVREHGSGLLLTAETPPDQWRIATPDLLSRLRLAPLFRLEPPGDDLLRAVLVKLFIDRQLIVDNAVIDYIALRIDRSLGLARTLVDTLDRMSLAAGRRISRATAAEALASALDLA